MGLDEFHLVRRDVLLKRNRLILGRERVMGQHGLKLVRTHVEPPRNEREVGA